MDQLSQEIFSILKDETNRRLIEESKERIFTCLDLLSEEEIWTRPNKNSNSVGNLVLHLCGNVRQYMLAGMDGQDDVRHRSLEFETTDGPNKIELKEKIRDVLSQTSAAIERLSPEKLIEVKRVQCYDEKVLSIIVHVIEHFSYHTGQIVFYTKLLKDHDMAFYAGQDLNKTQ